MCRESALLLVMAGDVAANCADDDVDVCGHVGVCVHTVCIVVRGWASVIEVEYLCVCVLYTFGCNGITHLFVLFIFIYIPYVIKLILDIAKL